MKQICAHKRIIFLLMLFSVLQAGCAPGRIEQLVINGIPATQGEIHEVQILSGDERTPARQRMALKPGDEIITDSNAMAIIWLQGGSRVFVGSDTHIRLVNPYHIIDLLSGLGDSISRLFIESKGALQINTEYVSAETEGTRFAVTLEPGDTATITVLDGTVRVASKTSSFQTVRVSRFRKVSIRAGQSPVSDTVSRDEANDIIQWVNRMETSSQRSDTLLLMPDVTGLVVDKAERVIRETGLSVRKMTGRITGKHPVGTIVRQTPAPGNRLRTKSGVILFFEAEAATVPSLVGLRLERSVTLLRKYNLVQGSVSHRVTGKWPPHTIIEQQPAAHSVVPAQTPINIVLEAESVVVPQLVNSHIDSAHNRITSARLVMGVIKQDLTDRYKPGMVRYQSVPAGSRVRTGTVINLTITAAGVRVPSIRNQPFPNAVDILRGAGLVPGRVTHSESSRHRADTVLSQSPQPGSLVRKGTPVHLVISVIPPVQASPPPGRIVPHPTVIKPTVIKPTVIRPTVTSPPTGLTIVPGKAIRCTVPNVMNMNEKNALAALRKMGLKGNITRRMSGNFVSKQSPGAGKKIRCGSVVELSIGTIY
ncbi:PASTA domain-containing protein [Desulfobacula sp.]|uniref:PASTA domain-containing protein n=1 Tax=Desulfobacula sp. TaxID=2593537 RepID=UPI00263A2567|nr:PASTA domain-containing protein [Desulfobacula sp.]